MATSSRGDVRILRDQLVFRRERLQEALSMKETTRLVQLLENVDQALERVDAGNYGECLHCHGEVEDERLLADPLATLCLDCLTEVQRRQLERDIELANRIQKGLLPKTDFKVPGWNICYHYEPAGLVSGDYCDLIDDGQGGLYFILGDVSGKGIAAALLMSNLHAMFRVLVQAKLELCELVQRASRAFCESTLPTQYATLVVGHANEGGEVEICNAGHLPVLLASNDGISRAESTGMPVGLFCEQEFTVAKSRVRPGDALVLFTDGISETENASGTQYGVDKIQELVREQYKGTADNLVEACRKHVIDFRGNSPRVDDETLLVIQYAGAASRESAA
jgi:sigma-B regulation protein RsbU (phosphoserine phosphatase)